MLILCIVCFLLPFAGRGAKLSINSMVNNVADWLPQHYQETKELEEFKKYFFGGGQFVVVSGPWCRDCLLYTSPSPRDGLLSRMPSSA